MEFKISQDGRKVKNNAPHTKTKYCSYHLMISSLLAISWLLEHLLPLGTLPLPPVEPEILLLGQGSSHKLRIVDVSRSILRMWTWTPRPLVATGTCLSDTGIHQGSFLAAPRNRCATTRNKTQLALQYMIAQYCARIPGRSYIQPLTIMPISCPKTLESNTNYLYVLSLILNHKACMVIKSQEKFHESGESKHISTSG